MRIPAGGECLRSGDELLALGLPAQLREFRRWLASGEVGAVPTPSDCRFAFVHLLDCGLPAGR